MGWSSSFPVVVRIPYDGFLWGFGVVTPDEDKVTRTRFLECSRGGGCKVQCPNREFVGISGWMVVVVVTPMVLVAG
jgi:hypothetical protein